MSRKAISVRVLKKVVKDRGEVFTTKDVSEDPRVMQAHRKLAKHSHYHAFVGGALSDHRDRLGIKEIQKRTARGSRWQKKGSLFGFGKRKAEPDREAVEQPAVRNPVERVQEPKLEKMVSLVCPACGGDLQQAPATKEYVCEHCRNRYVERS